jgi:hypothetical protein
MVPVWETMMSPPAPELPVVPPIAIATPFGLSPTWPSPITASPPPPPTLCAKIAAASSPQVEIVPV